MTKKTARTPKAESIALDLVQLAEKVGPDGSIYSKISPFDFDHVCCTSYAILMRDGPSARVLTFQVYNGRLSAKQSGILDLAGGVPVDAQVAANSLLKRGYTLISPASGLKKTRARRGTRELAEPASSGPRRRRRKAD